MATTPARKALEGRVGRLERLARERREAEAAAVSAVQMRVLEALSEDDKWRVVELHDAMRAGRMTEAEALAEALPLWRGLAEALAATDPEAAAHCRAIVEEAEAGAGVAG